VPARRLSIGDAAQAAERLEAGVPADLVVIAPGRGQASRGWIAEAVAQAASRLAGGGLVWLVAPPHRRRDALRMLREAGLHPQAAVLSSPAPGSPAHVASLAPAPLRDLAMRQLGWSATAAGAAGALARPAAGRALLRHAMPGCALLAARPGAAAPLAWLA
jgi:hypothetical protein